MTTLAIARDTDGRYPSWAWPGGYPIFYLMDDSETLCPDCANDPSNPVHEDRESDGWKIIGHDINYEDPHMTCCHCGNRIPSAYAEE